MAIQINQGYRPQEKQEAPAKDPMDTILKGLQLAIGVYGIKEAGTKAELLKAQQAESVKATQFTQAAKEAELSGQGYEKNVGDNGAVSFLRPPGFVSKDDAAKDAQTAKIIAETEYIRSGKAKEKDPMVTELQAQRLADLIEKRKAAEFAKTPEGRLKGLNSGDKQRLDNAKLGLVSVQGMADALANGQNTFSPLGDNDYTQQRALFEEALGRMQSGGAISKEEESRFKSMAPTWRDSPEIQQKKLAQLQTEMQSRLGTLGFKPDELGVT